jgi:protein SDA1
MLLNNRLLAIFAQACHEHVPPDELQPISRHIADAFVTERNAPEAMALGINALREIVSRVPSLLEEPEMLGFARDIAVSLLLSNK